jgi:glycerol-3-phosphate cytidylyltransferase
MIIGYTSGVFDLFHKGHVNVLRNAKSLCDKLIVGVSTDELVLYKNKKPVIGFQDRLEVVRACRYVDVVVPQKCMDKIEAYQKFKFNLMFVGDDWYESEKWRTIERQLSDHNVNVIYFPYTSDISSTKINEMLKQERARP